ncbi:MAG: proton-conducting membrane transporter [Actinobacteria bacterium]|nr:proton-conducting membrane transporter [Actinomycetota bacterium]
MNHLHLAHPHADVPATTPLAAGAVRMLDGSAVLPLHDAEQLTGVTVHDLAAHRALFGPRRSYLGHAADTLLADMDAVELSGRGGGHFPTAAKWRSVARAGAGGTVVANAAEGEPAIAKDAVLLLTRPHLVLDGLAAAVEVLGAREGVVWLHDGAWASARSVTRALEERRHAGELDPPIRIMLAPARYLSGEATGIIRTLEGGPTLPRWVADPARPWSAGERPVLVNNAETLARAALLGHVGAAAYAPTSLLTVVSDTYRVVVEAGPDETFGQVLARSWRSPDGQAPVAALLGGYGGSWVRWEHLAPLPVSNPALKPFGLSVGAGLLGPLPQRVCGLEESGRILRYLAGQSAKQCGPCVFGLPAVADLVDRLVEGRLGRRDKHTLDTYVREISGRGACRHPDGALRMLSTALTVFADDVARHKHGRSCDAPLHSVLPIPADPEEA